MGYGNKVDVTMKEEHEIFVDGIVLYLIVLVVTQIYTGHKMMQNCTHILYQCQIPSSNMGH